MKEGNGNLGDRIKDLLKKSTLNDFSKEEFAVLLEEISSATGGEQYQDELINHFIVIVPHPDGSDLLFWVPDEEAAASVVIRKIEKWCESNHISGFKD